MKYLKSINPFDNQELNSYPEDSENTILEKINLAANAQTKWQKFTIQERINVLNKVKNNLVEKKEVAAQTMSLEMGKPLLQSLAEIDKSISLFDYYFENIFEIIKDKKITSSSFITYQPLGVVFGIMPWNFPFWQVLRFAVPATITGNTCLLKHASNVQGCAKIIENLFPNDLKIFQNLCISSDKAELVIKNPHIKSVSLTGSAHAGKSVASLCGKYLKKSILELGGSDPYLVLEDADIELAAKKSVQSRILNNGQTCISAKRFIIHENIYASFKEAFIGEAKKIKYGNPLDKTTQIGPLAKLNFKEDLKKQVDENKNLGAQIGFESGSNEGAFYPITILENITKSMPAYDDEFFGPVACFYKFKNLDEAIHLANDTSFGLGAGIFSQNTELALEIAKTQLQAGSCAVNNFVKSDPALPFGGIKESGYGRELSSHGALEFTNIKSVKVGS